MATRRTVSAVARRATDLLRRVAHRSRHELTRLRRTTVRPYGGDAVLVTRLGGLRRRVVGTDPEASAYALRGGTVRLVVEDPSVLARLVNAGVLTGHLDGARVRLTRTPPGMVTAVRPPRPGPGVRRARWHRRGRRVAYDLDWWRPHPTAPTLADMLAATLRARQWDQLSGPVYALDAAAWRHGASTWPHGRLGAAGPDPAGATDGDGHPVGPYTAVSALATPATTGPPAVPAVLGAAANPVGRTLAGAATRYRLAAPASDRLELCTPDGTRRLVWRAADTGGLRGPEAALAGATVSRYAVVQVDDEAAPALASEAYAAGVVTALACCGMVFATRHPRVRAQLDSLGLVTVDDPGAVDDLPGYALSVAASRRALFAADPALRRTALGPAGDATVPLPSVSVLLSSKRPDDVESCLRHLAAQTYPQLEILVGAHGYEPSDQERRRWRKLLACPLRVETYPEELPFGAVLGRLTRAADGELVTKVDDDDHYGPHHVTDLVLAWHTSGADLVAKGARFVYLPERDATIDRAWAAPEGFQVTPAGGTLLVSRGTLASLGGWSHSPWHVDTDLVVRTRDAGGLVHRTHALEYVYVRRAGGHTFATDLDALTAQGQRTYPGLPPTLLHPDGNAARG